MNDLDNIINLWESIKHDIPDKNKTNVLKNVLLQFEEMQLLTYNELCDLRDIDKTFDMAVDIIYKEDALINGPASEYDDGDYRRDY